MRLVNKRIGVVAVKGELQKYGTKKAAPKPERLYFAKLVEPKI